MEACNHQAGFAQYVFPGIEILEILTSRFQFTEYYFDQISENFQSFVSRLGEFAAGDEKLLYFTGNIKNIRMILTKPDRAGHSFYELSVSNWKMVSLFYCISERMYLILRWVSQLRRKKSSRTGQKLLRLWEAREPTLTL